jgi:hypothetical protein
LNLRNADPDVGLDANVGFNYQIARITIGEALSNLFKRGNTLNYKMNKPVVMLLDPFMLSADYRIEMEGAAINQHLLHRRQAGEQFRVETMVPVYMQEVFWLVRIQCAIIVQMLCWQFTSATTYSIPALKELKSVAQNKQRGTSRRTRQAPWGTTKTRIICREPRHTFPDTNNPYLLTFSFPFSSTKLIQRYNFLTREVILYESY